MARDMVVTCGWCPKQVQIYDALENIPHRVLCKECDELLYRYEGIMFLDYSGYKWVRVNQHKYNAIQSWEDNYKELERHHIEETTFLIEEIRKLAERLKKYEQE